jgi:hypothetical protein
MATVSAAASINWVARLDGLTRENAADLASSAPSNLLVFMRLSAVTVVYP